MKLFDLTGKNVIITGGTRGIGFAIAKGMQAAGANVWIHGSNKERTEAVAKQHNFSFLYGDLRNIDALDVLLEPFWTECEKLDVLVNNAGIETHRSIADGKEDAMDEIYNVNTKAPYFLLQKLLPALKKANGASIINVTSIHEKVPVRENGYYCMAKSSLAMLTKVAALELAKFGVRVNNLAPGAILTDMNQELVEAMDFGEWIPMQRVGRAEELAGPAIFLASDASSYVTGTTLFVDGGYSENLLRY
ncbi:MAG: SDR family oxidoreductase [Butyricicoccus pullicaecorum]|nr:SDR family oxidoreductase [Butyricicoccus pullicaecorum]